MRTTRTLALVAVVWLTVPRSVVNVTTQPGTGVLTVRLRVAVRAAMPLAKATDSAVPVRTI